MTVLIPTEGINVPRIILHTNLPCVAFAMGVQKRLGYTSVVYGLNPEIVRMVLAKVPGQTHTTKAEL